MIIKKDDYEVEFNINRTKSGEDVFVLNITQRIKNQSKLKPENTTQLFLNKEELQAVAAFIKMNVDSNSPLEGKVYGLH